MGVNNLVVKLSTPIEEAAKWLGTTRDPVVALRKVAKAKVDAADKLLNKLCFIKDGKTVKGVTSKSLGEGLTKYTGTHKGILIDVTRNEAGDTVEASCVRRLLHGPNQGVLTINKHPQSGLKISSTVGSSAGNETKKVLKFKDGEMTYSVNDWDTTVPYNKL